MATLGRCTNGLGYRENHPADGWLVTPDGRQTTAMCRAAAQAVIEEYAAKLGERWTFEEGG